MTTLAELGLVEQLEGMDKQLKDKYSAILNTMLDEEVGDCNAILDAINNDINARVRVFMKTKGLKTLYVQKKNK